GHEPEGVERGDDGLARGLSGDHALVILDLMLPGLDGFEVCRRLRATHPDLPILMLTARGVEADVLEGFRCGADDYVTKPFSVSELVARLGALLRRSGARPDESPSPFDFGGWKIDPGDLSARRGGQRISLTRRESDLLALLVRDAGRIVSRRKLLREIWRVPEPDRIETRTVDMHVAKLRKKLGEGSALIETVRGEGYRFAG
ncbi:MAG: response regulator transcription factor, partial [Myxococcota bacterium]